MNTPIVRLYAFMLILLTLLVVFTSNWAVFDADELEAKSENKRPLLEQQKIARGEIKSSDGELLAVSESRGRGERKVFVREYPTGELFAHPVGYDYIGPGRTGIEQSENDVLTGESNEFATIIEQLSGQTEEGSDLTITVDAGAQQLATDLLNGQGAPGAVVALDPKTGAIRTMASTPSYDPNLVPEQINELNNPPAGATPVLINRATQNPYPPGSTMKVVTAAAALDSGEFTPDSTVDGSSPQDVSGVPLENFGNQSFGEITLTEALTNSVNTAWANVGEDLGTDTMVDYMERFGFYGRPEFDYPEDQIRASGPTKTNGRLAKSGFDVGRVAIGQGGAEGQMLATPLQMALVAATVANDGVQMRPTFLQEVKDPDGRVSEELDPEEVRRVISEESAAQLTQMMVNVTEDGTASGLNVGGVTFAGKTGTAELNNDGLNQPWFIMFAPADDPQIAVAATIERCQGCSGGGVAGPIATAVAEDLLG